MTKEETKKREGEKEIEDLIEKIEIINKYGKKYLNTKRECAIIRKEEDLIQELWETASFYGDVYDFTIGEGSGKFLDKGKIWRDKSYGEREKALNKIYALEEKGKLERWDLDYIGLTGWTIWL